MHQHALHLDRTHILAARDDDVLRAVGDLDIAVRVLEGDVAGAEPAALEGLGRGGGVLVIALHHHVAAHGNLAQMRAVAGDGGPGAVMHLGPLQHGHGDAGARLVGGAVVLGGAVPFRAPGAFRGGAVGFRQAIDLRHVEAERLKSRQRGGGGRRAGGKDFDDVRERAAVFVAGVDEGVEHDGRAAEMGDAFIGDGVVDGLCGDVAAADQRAGEDRRHPGMGPAIAVEERHDGQIDRMQHHAPGQDIGRGRKIGPAMVIDHALGAAGGAGGVVDGDGFPFVLRHDPCRRGVAFGQEFVIGQVMARGGEAFIHHFDDPGDGALHAADGLFRQGQEGGVAEHDLRARMAEDVGHRIGVEPRVDGVQDRSGGGDAEMGHGLCRDVGHERRHHIARADAVQRQRRGEAGDLFGIDRIAEAGGFPDHGGAVGVDVRRPLQEGQRRERHVIRRTFLQSGFIGQPAHSSLPPANSCVDVVFGRAKGR